MNDNLASSKSSRTLELPQTHTAQCLEEEYITVKYIVERSERKQVRKRCICLPPEKEI